MARQPNSAESSASESSGLAARVRETPRPSDAKGAREKLADLPKADRKTAARLEALIPEKSKARALVEGIADGSPFLWEIAKSDPAGLAALLETDPEASLASIVETATKAARTAKNEEIVMHALRKMRREAALLVALADIGGVWSVAEFTRALTTVADTAINIAVEYLLRQADAAGKIRLADPARRGSGSGYFVLGMGKLGAFEMNYSSDIDLIVMYDRSAPLERELDPSPFFV
ncbi:MAG: bifunctional [glutamine synthetase] adenylyltransferase/[glutamine synthetase]-adenylyl-L-tyrosine phosphorylase, partial [Xanthobacteraceae bacterium]